MSKVIDAIKKIARQQNLQTELNESAYDLPFKQIGIDSITAISIIVGVEQELGVRIQDDALPNITTINKLIKELEKLLDK